MRAALMGQFPWPISQARFARRLIFRHALSVEGRDSFDFLAARRR